jgi:hypothetical protein
MIGILFLNMCDWTTNKVFFKNINDPSTLIVQRSFGCGATDSSLPKIEVSKTIQITPYFIWVTDIDTTQINKSEWTRVEKTD